MSDYVRLWALSNEGGIYLDTDVEVFRAFDELLKYDAFAGFEGSKHLPVGTCVMASKVDGLWVNEMLDCYGNRHFVKSDGSFDMTTNVQFISAIMSKHGFVQNGKEQDYKDLHVFPVDYFCPRHTTGEYICTENTFCDHLGLGSWTEQCGWKAMIGKMIGPKVMPHLIKMKRRWLG